MNITKTNENGKITLALDGWLDTAASPELAAAIEEIESATEIVLDFDKVEYMASSGLRQVVASHKKAKEIGAELSIINAHTEIMSIFSLTGLDKKLSIKSA
ncbi:MAG: STAS domain-containing protein [Clostridiales bacterium]|nr:STAS domain-containing protein [Candidatus Equinaster intestinalis]